MARPRKDPALKSLRGHSLRRDREPKASAIAAAGQMVAPTPLVPRALEHFDVIVALLAKEGRASQHHAYTVALLAMRIEQIESLSSTIADEGSTYETHGESGTVHRPRPEVAMRTDAMRHAQALLSELMLSPTAALRLGAAEKPKTNRFAEL